jgi:hypothetical protein
MGRQQQQQRAEERALCSCMRSQHEYSMTGNTQQKVRGAALQLHFAAAVLRALLSQHSNKQPPAASPHLRSLR